MKILIAEDDRISSKLLVTNLTKWGYEVVVVTDGPAAVNAYTSDQSFDMAILDWMMPGLEGPDVCKTIKNSSSEHFTYIVLLTAKTQKEDIVTALEAGADDYITKPWDAAELKARVRAGERVVKLERRLREKVAELEAALAHVKQLQGIIPICAWCKKIRDDSDYWGSVEEYISKHSEAEFSHGICPECMAKLYSEETTTR